MIYRPAKTVAKELRKAKLYRQSAIVHVSSEKHAELYDRMRQDPAHAHESDEEIHQRAAYYLVWHAHGRYGARLRKRVLYCALLVVLILGIWVGTAHCQIDVIQFQQNSTPVTSFAAPFKMNFAGCTLGRSASTITITCSGGTNTPGGADKQVQYNITGSAFGGIAFGTNGQVLESCGTNCIPQFQDPIVSGPTANGVAPSATNPIWIGGWDATNIHALLTDASGRLAVNVNGTVPVSGTFWQATQPVSGTFFQSTQPVSIASMPSTPVTGTFWQATQPVSGTFWQATQPVSIASMPSTPVTGTFFQATQPVSGTVTANQGTSPWVTSATLAAETSKVIGTVNQGTSPWVTSATLAAETTKVIGTVRTVGNIGAVFDAATNGAIPANQVWVVNAPTTAAGGAVTASVKATVTSSVNVKASAGSVYGLSVANGAAAVCWVQFINSAGTGTLGTGVIFSIALPSSGVVTIPPGTLALSNFATGIAVGVASSTNSSTACGTGANLTVFFD